MMGLPQVVWERHHLKGEKQVYIRQSVMHVYPRHNTGVVLTCSGHHMCVLVTIQVLLTPHT